MTTYFKPVHCRHFACWVLRYLFEEYHGSLLLLFELIVNNIYNVLRLLLSERLSNGCNFCSRQHDFILLDKTNRLTDSAFIIRMLYKNCY